ncbi:oligopeptide transport system permease protein [Fontimonas thermophila]|uniref:Oligopeptide transport system permease protein n=1 Tax=Fontimonas thermophila TaxID=1076937 RepID=A0A1I2JV79_9GAMM|nr:ABC transporter permease subunit [Fontimonas thermophila]SFF58464.1 oligopeptide transport system permease protein [Fontimonas thermophila]
MIYFVVRRLAAAVVTLLVLLTLALFLMRAAPGGPLDRERSLPPGIEAALVAQYRLDAPLWQQYLDYLGAVLRGDLGPSFQYEGYRVSELIAAGLPVSLLLGALALVCSLLVGGCAGIIAAVRRGGVLDRIVSVTVLAGMSVPGFVVAPLLILLFALTLDVLPAGGWSGDARELVLPVITLALPQLAVVARLLRAELIEVLDSPHVLAARGRGLPQWRVLLYHALPPALIPVISYLGPAAAGLVTGSVVVEQIFGIPGIGRYFVQGALNRDYTLVLGVVLLYGVLIVSSNLIVDALYGVLDPRVRHA